MRWLVTWPRATCLVGVAILWAATALPQTSTPTRVAEANANQPAAELLPEAPYAPISPGQKFTAFTTQLYSPFTCAAAGLSGGWGQMTDSPPEYGAGAKGYGKRFGCSLADTELSIFFNKFLYPVILREDPRYLPARPASSLWQRVQYAATRVVIVRNDRGRSEFNYSEAFGNVSNASLDNAYFAPSQRTFGRTMSRFGALYAADALVNLGRELWPDIRRILPGGRKSVQSTTLLIPGSDTNPRRLPSSH